MAKNSDKTPNYFAIIMGHLFAYFLENLKSTTVRRYRAKPEELFLTKPMNILVCAPQDIEG